MRPLAVIPLLLLAICRPSASANTKRFEVAPGTFVVIEQAIRKGFAEGSVHTSMSVEWPNSSSPDEIGQVSYYNGTEDIRLLKAGSYNVVVYGSTFYHRPVDGSRKWFKWAGQNSAYSPPVPSIASYLRDWFRANGRTGFTFTPYVEGASEEQIAFQLTPDGQQIVFGCRTHWTIPYRLSIVDPTANTIRYETSTPGLPRFLVFTGPPKVFGAWFFDPKATAQANQ